MTQNLFVINFHCFLYVVEAKSAPFAYYKFHKLMRESYTEILCDSANPQADYINVHDRTKCCIL